MSRTEKPKSEKMRLSAVFNALAFVEVISAATLAFAAVAFSSIPLSLAALSACGMGFYCMVRGSRAAMEEAAANAPPPIPYKLLRNPQPRAQRPAASMAQPAAVPPPPMRTNFPGMGDPVASQKAFDELCRSGNEQANAQPGPAPEQPGDDTTLQHKITVSQPLCLKLAPGCA